MKNLRPFIAGSLIWTLCMSAGQAQGLYEQKKERLLTLNEGSHMIAVCSCPAFNLTLSEQKKYTSPAFLERGCTIAEHQLVLGPSVPYSAITGFPEPFGWTFATEGGSTYTLVYPKEKRSEAPAQPDNAAGCSNIANDTFIIKSIRSSH